MDIIKSPSIPAGILSNICMEHIHRQLNVGDFIIMVTDGIVDSFKKQDESDYDLRTFISTIQSINPQEIADLIMKKACENCADIPEDDMLVMVSKLWRKVS